MSTGMHLITMRTEMRRGLAIFLLVLLGLPAGCGGSEDTLAPTASELREVSGSVAEAVEKWNREAFASLEESGAPQAGESTTRPRHPCVEAGENARSRSGTEAEFTCISRNSFSSSTGPGHIDFTVSVYDLDEDGCWKGVNVGLDSDSFGGEELSQAKIDSGERDLHGCIGEAPPSQGIREFLAES